MNMYNLFMFNYLSLLLEWLTDCGSAIPTKVAHGRSRNLAFVQSVRLDVSAGYQYTPGSC